MSNERTGGKSQDQPNTQDTSRQNIDTNKGTQGGLGTAAVRAADTAASSPRREDTLGNTGNIRPVPHTGQSGTGTKDFGQSRSIAGTAGTGESQYDRDRRYFARGPQTYSGTRYNEGGRSMKGLWAALIGVGAGIAAVYFLGQNRGSHRRTELRSFPNTHRSPQNRALHDQAERGYRGDPERIN